MKKHEDPCACGGGGGLECPRHSDGSVIPRHCKHHRISRPQMFVEILNIVKQRSTCARAQVSALVIKDNRVVSMGYGGAPSGLPHCTEVGCEIGPSGGCIRTIHAEANAIAFAARHGISIEGAELWCSLSPCLDCAKLIINSGIVKVVYLEEYRKTDGIDLLKKAGIDTTQYCPDHDHN